MSVDDWARREAADQWPEEEHEGRNRSVFAHGIVHAFSALLSDEAVEAAAAVIPNRWEVNGRCWAEHAGGDEYCRFTFDTEAEAIRHRDDHHADRARVWAHKEQEELLTEARAVLQAALDAVTKEARGQEESGESFADRLARQSDDAAEAKWGVRPNGTMRRSPDSGREADRG